MMDFNNIIRENIKEYNSKWPRIPDHSHRILIMQGSGSGKTNALLKLSDQPDIDYCKEPIEAKYQLLIKKCESVYLK